jgi:hypothetical protein
MQSETGIQIQCSQISKTSVVDLDPAFYLNADTDTDPDLGSQTNADQGGSGS